MQEQIGRLQQQRAGIVDNIGELERGLAKLQLAQRSGVSVADLVTITVTVPSDKVSPSCLFACIVAFERLSCRALLTCHLARYQGALGQGQIAVERARD
jgi:hypothetical protein